MPPTIYRIRYSIEGMFEGEREVLYAKLPPADSSKLVEIVRRVFNMPNSLHPVVQSAYNALMAIADSPYPIYIHCNPSRWLTCEKLEVE